MRRLLIAAAFATASAFPLATAQDDPALTPAKVDIDRFQGLWHEVARYQNPLQPDACVNATQEFGFNEDGNLAVVGTCTDDATREVETTLGTASFTDAETPAALSLSYGEGGAEELWIVAVADDYSWSIVSAPSRDRLWLMTREPVTGGPVKDMLYARADEMGFDTSKLFLSQQGGLNLSSSLDTGRAY